MKSIMYHYVREYSDQYPNFKYLHFNDFCKQLDFFEEEYGFVTQDEWGIYLEGGKGIDSSKVILTFDDSVSCHYNYVYRELLRRGLWGIFYIPAKPYIESKMLDVHKVHLLCGKYSGNVLLKAMERRVSDEMVPHSKREEFKKFTYNKQINERSVSQIKRTLNYYVEDNLKEALIDDISRDLRFDGYSMDFYCSRSQLEEMAEGSMLLGSHTVSHPVMSKLDFNTQEKEIRNSFEFISSLTNSKYKTYCHPYGGFHSFNDDTLKILSNECVDFSFNVWPEDIEGQSTRQNKNSLPRYDCNEFPYGQVS